MTETRVIKRYANRKLYDTQRSRYVTLDQIAEMIREGEDVKIVDNNSKEDLTTVTLAQIIFEEEKKQKSFLPLNAMRNIIQSGGERIEELVTQAQKKVSGVFSRKHVNGEGGEPLPGTQTDDETPAADASVPGEAGNPGPGALHEFREWIEASQQKLEEWQKKMDDRVRHIVEGISPFASLQKEVAALGARLAEVERKLSHVDRDRASAETTPTPSSTGQATEEPAP